MFVYSYEVGSKPRRIMGHGVESQSWFTATQWHIKKDNQTFFIENLFGISINEISDENSSLVFYKSSLL